jgi:hypothetical protein
MVAFAGAAYPNMRARWFVAEDEYARSRTSCTDTTHLDRGGRSLGTYGGRWRAGCSRFDGGIADSERQRLEVGWVDFFHDVDTPDGEEESASAHVVDISPGFEFVWRERFDKLRRRRARNAGEKGIVVRRTSDVGDVGRFVSLYRARLEGWEAGSGYPDRLFRDLVANGGARVGMYPAGRGRSPGPRQFLPPGRRDGVVRDGVEGEGDLHAGTFCTRPPCARRARRVFVPTIWARAWARRRWKNTSARWAESCIDTASCDTAVGPDAWSPPCEDGGSRDDGASLALRR